MQLLSSLVNTVDRHEGWCTRLVLIIDGLDSCEQDKLLQVLETMSLVIPDNSPFIVLLALDPHIIISGIEASQRQVLTHQQCLSLQTIATISSAELFRLISDHLSLYCMYFISICIVLVLYCISIVLYCIAPMFH